jgi:hypothetical protein
MKIKLINVALTSRAFSTALAAVLPSHVTGGNPKIDLQAWATHAENEDEAFELGIAHAFELWPEAQGWTNHAARTVELTMPNEMEVTADQSIPVFEPEVTEERIM